MKKKIECENQAIQFLNKIATIPKEHLSVEHLGEHPKVTLRETKGHFRRGTEKLSLRDSLSYYVVCTRKIVRNGDLFVYSWYGRDKLFTKAA